MASAQQPEQTRTSISAEQVRKIFQGLERGDGAAFFQHVADDVDWTVMGTHRSPATTLAKRLSLKAHSPSWDVFFHRVLSYTWSISS